MAILTRGEIADLKERSKVINVRFSASVVSDLVGANLSGANLIGADLSRAKLSGANLFGADLEGAIGL